MQAELVLETLKSSIQNTNDKKVNVWDAINNFGAPVKTEVAIAA
jgi:hypothetical protein